MNKSHKKRIVLILKIIERPKIDTILIANRSEIASRIMATCRAMNLKTVAIYCEEDAFHPYVFEANEAHQLSKPGISGYLDQEEIIQIAYKTHADAIHPGYGFLAENADFAKKVIDTGLCWVGPNPSIITTMSNKTKARSLMRQSGIPVIPGYHCKNTSNNEKKIAKQYAEKLGYPVLLKASLGGGGKAMRCVTNSKEFDSTWDAVMSEAQHLCLSEELFIEKYLQNTRHIEVQIVGDGTHFIHLYERECSIQRHHQKIIEETPCMFISQATLQKMYDTAIKAAQVISYDNVGTIEFLVTPQEKFYFLEMNTRLQVEHPITEMVTGIDLVALQIHLAEKKNIPYQQHDIMRRGYAIECRICAEDPENNFIPSAGTIKAVLLPHGPFIRHDHNLEAGMEISTLFDSMLSKLVAFGVSRTITRAHLINALKQLEIVGIKTNKNLLQTILSSSEFANGTFHTRWLETFMLGISNDTTKTTSSIDTESIALIAATLANEIERTQQNTTQPNNKPKKLYISRWRQQAWQ